MTFKSTLVTNELRADGYDIQIAVLMDIAPSTVEENVLAGRQAGTLGKVKNGSMSVIKLSQNKNREKSQKNRTFSGLSHSRIVFLSINNILNIWYSGTRTSST